MGVAEHPEADTAIPDQHEIKERQYLDRRFGKIFKRRQLAQLVGNQDNKADNQGLQLHAH